MRSILTLLISLIIAQSAGADGIWRRGSEQDDASDRSKLCGESLDSRETCYHTYTNADTNSVAIEIKSKSRLCLNPDITTAGPATATIRLRLALTADTTIDAFNWMPVLNIILTGDWTVTPQLVCEWDIPPGTYYVESVVAPGAQDVVVSLQGSQ